MINNNLRLKKVTNNLDGSYDLLRDKLRALNVSQIGEYGKNEPLFLGYYNDKDKMVAGLYAYFSLGMLYIDLLCVDENCREEKLGSSLLVEAENFARSKKALYV